MVRLEQIYKRDIAPKLKNDFGYVSNMQVPKIEKIVINAGVGRSTKESREMDEVVEGLTMITGQAPVKTKSKKSIAGFKIRENVEIGCMVTLRGARMYEFLDRLVNVALPRVRDFRGVNANSFDGKGNYSLGIKDHTIFPEIPYEKFSHPFSFQVNIITSAGTDEEARKALSYLGFPFRGQEVPKN